MEFDLKGLMMGKPPENIQAFDLNNGFFKVFDEKEYKEWAKSSESDSVSFEKAKRDKSFLEHLRKKYEKDCEKLERRVEIWFGDVDKRWF